jgi:hypothetical protein
MPIYKNPLNMKIFNEIQDVLGWNIEPDSVVADLPISRAVLLELERRFSVNVRGNNFKVEISTQHERIRDLVQDIDGQYTRNYFVSESGTYNGLIKVTDWKGASVETIVHKWKIRGKNLIEKIKKMQQQNQNLSILDLGCGYNLYKDHLANVTGVDPYIEVADYVCRIQDFEPPKKYDIIICFGPMNWYTFDEQVRNMRKIKECLAEDGVCYWSHVHNYYKIYQPDANRAHTWVAGSIEDAYKNNAFYFFDQLWKFNQYFNWTEEALLAITGKVDLVCGEMQYDDCGCYRPPMWRLFCELRHAQ